MRVRDLSDALTAADAADSDVILIEDTSADVTKKMTLAELLIKIGTNTEFHADFAAIASKWNAESGRDFTLTAPIASGQAWVMSTNDTWKLVIDDMDMIVADGNAVAIEVPLRLRSYTVTQLNAVTGMAAGDTVYCSNGDAGSACLATYDGTDWKRIALGATVASS